ncbi:RHS repeat-associated core domain-containing protein, partial [Escherichia marmotae]|nr:RHS repeat-associated core domain-containing protein [Escherichia marmotae]MEC9972837.1 RHS repeat-associated core domain-containing protein [Escherichia marmotae]MEC9987064.1 RHS repeat-associated core domain-containing protein [Escherichia marmotae]MED0080390.1 RHS repeat-associated core domain-containing protein [Escherichia marmotae]MED0122308.1 RHS repeat-associated core domain-containing protein [Escherichia marmotae]
EQRRTTFVWEGFRLLQETTWQGKRTYLYDAEQPYTPVAAVTGRGESRKIWYYHTDVTGTVQEVSAADGTLVWVGYQAGFGENRGDISNSGAYFEQPLRLPGQYFDEETGLHYNLFRYYAPECGRFISQDPIGLRGGLNLYAYVKNPLTWIDPLGLAGCSAQFKSRNEAFRAAKRDAGIPMNQQPDRIFNSKTGFYGDHRNVPMTDSRKNPIFDSNGNQVWTREYQFTRADGTKIIIQDHSAGHSYPNGIGNQGPHLNVRPIENTRTGSVPGTFDHYEF